MKKKFVWKKYIIVWKKQHQWPWKLVLEKNNLGGKNIRTSYIGLSTPFVLGEKYFLRRHDSKRYLASHK